jgi:hypothetical protein
MHKHIGFALAVATIFVTPPLWADQDTGYVTAAELASWCEPYRKAVLDGNTATVQGYA